MRKVRNVGRKVYFEDFQVWSTHLDEVMVLSQSWRP